MFFCRVVCRQLYGTGYTGRCVSGLYAWDGSGRIWMTDVHCNGHEATLQECQFTSEVPVDVCSHSNDVGVVCRLS